jgi:VIT1/CCC1 family predicted Fe2+/Mn2+ transporter
MTRRRSDSIVRLHPTEPHVRESAQRLNRLRAGVLGANDGIVSVAALVVGVAGATTASATILAAGAAGLVGGAISMALGEYVSVSSQRDSERAMIAEERRELEQDPAGELDELAQLYVTKGLTLPTAQAVAEQLTAQDPVAAHLDAELNLVAEDMANPMSAAWASAGSFALGGALPFLTMLLLPSPIRVAATFVVVLIALALTGGLGARLGGSPPLRPTIRVVIGGALALAVTFALGAALGRTGVI